MQCPPPRPRPSSAPRMVITSIAGLAQQRVGVGVAVVGDDHARLERHDVVAVVPLLALRLVGVAAGRHRAQLLEPKRLRDHLEQRLSDPGAPRNCPSSSVG